MILLYFKSKIDEFGDTPLKIFIDMDGVVADYDIGGDFDYSIKRPLNNNIKQIEEISHYKNIELYIFSITRHNDGISQKNDWLDKYMPFIKKENRVILSREDNDMKRSRYIKAEYLMHIVDDKYKIILIDDDPSIIDEVREAAPSVITMKDTVLVD